MEAELVPQDSGEQLDATHSTEVVSSGLIRVRGLGTSIVLGEGLPDSGSIAATQLIPNLSANDPLFPAAEATAQLIQKAGTPSTKRAYTADWKDFVAWCEKTRLASLPATPTTVALYCGEMSEIRELRPATVLRRLAAINNRHREQGFDPPASRANLIVSRTLKGMHKTKGRKQVGKSPLSVALLQRMIEHTEGSLSASRDRALFLVGFCGGLRRSELAAIELDHLHWHGRGPDRGITVEIPRSKTDQEGEGREVELVYGIQPQDTPLHKLTCPVRALEQWLEQANIKSGMVFRKVSWAQTVGPRLNKDSIGRIIKRGLERAKKEDSHLARIDVRDFSGHSLRAGFATEAYRNGAKDIDIMKQTGHKSRKMLEKYIRSERASRQAAAAKLGM